MRSAEAHVHHAQHAVPSQLLQHLQLLQHRSHQHLQLQPVQLLIKSRDTSKSFTTASCAHPPAPQYAHPNQTAMAHPSVQKEVWANCRGGRSRRAKSSSSSRMVLHPCCSICSLSTASSISQALLFKEAQLGFLGRQKKQMALPLQKQFLKELPLLDHHLHLLQLLLETRHQHQ